MSRSIKKGPFVDPKLLARIEKMNEENKFYAGYWIRRFLCEYLTNIRNLSANTLKSYRDAIRLLMPFIAKCVKKEVDKILLTDITDTRVADFLESLERNRSCSIKTRNLRLAAFVLLQSMYPPIVRSI